MPDRTQEIRNLEDALNAGAMEVDTGTTKIKFVDPEDMRRRLRELRAEQEGAQRRPVAASIHLGGF
jgi:hypothetical protein